ncbi:fused MFS/spermidine synthase [Corynebacterium sp.]|uniref:spermidine synthase n=1 Tax=Corynebacterium sp. TaxID=1720 RepID=UPI002A91A7E0|nr:fused MFS/spermidine synthase [Corynebacterium sp.]MDY5785095.1 fused MFS/spermidine synthase [Corynebacterium sp.]
MRKYKPRHLKPRIEGAYPIDTGTARVVADPLRDGAFTLEVNNVPSSYVVPGAPEVLEYDYMRWIAGFIDLPEPFEAVHLGAAGCALPSYVAHRWDSRNTAVELDRGLARLVREVFVPPVRIVVAEARAFTHALTLGSVDLIVRDVFAGPATPRPLTTVEFFRAAHRALRPGGIYVANIGDRAGLGETRAEIAGLAEVFAHVAAVSTAEMFDGRAYGNIVVAASDSPLAYTGEAEFRGAEWARSLGGTPRYDRRG